MPRLLIVRHAKAATAVQGANDHSRPLAPAGVAQLPHLAAAVVAALAAPAPASPDSARRDSARLDPAPLDPAPLDLVLCSPSARTRETVAGLVQAEPQLGAARVKVKRALYLADVDDLLTVLRHLPDNVETALICGHNPGLHELALTLLGPAADAQLRQGLPTAGLVVVDLDTNWASIGAQ